MNINKLFIVVIQGFIYFDVIDVRSDPFAVNDNICNKRLAVTFSYLFGRYWLYFSN